MILLAMAAEHFANRRNIHGVLSLLHSRYTLKSVSSILDGVFGPLVKEWCDTEKVPCMLASATPETRITNFNMLGQGATYGVLFPYDHSALTAAMTMLGNGIPVSMVRSCGKLIPMTTTPIRIPSIPPA